MCQHRFADIPVARRQHEFLIRMYDVGAFPINDKEVGLVLASFLVLTINLLDVVHKLVSQPLQR